MYAGMHACMYVSSTHACGEEDPPPRNLVMSLGFVGSAAGSMFFGWLCDRIGCTLTGIWDFPEIRVPE